MSTSARAVGLERVFAPQVDAVGDHHPAYDADEGELERTDCEVDVVVSENKAKAESRSESAARRMEGKAEADASAMRTDG